MIPFRKVFRVRLTDATYSEVMESKYILRTPSAIVSIEDYLAPGLDGGYKDKPKTQIDFANGTQIVVLGSVDETSRKLTDWDKKDSMGLNGEKYLS